MISYAIIKSSVQKQINSLGGGGWSFWKLVEIHMSLVSKRSCPTLVLYWLLSSWLPCNLEVPSSSNVSPAPITDGLAQPYQLSWACAAQLSVVRRTNCELDSAFSCGALEVCRWTNDVRNRVKELSCWQFKGLIRRRRLLSECDRSDLKI